MSRSTALLRSLSVERQRWETGSNAFQTQMGTIVGDVLLSSAFLAYGGTLKLKIFLHLFLIFLYSTHVQHWPMLSPVIPRGSPGHPFSTNYSLINFIIYIPRFILAFFLVYFCLVGYFDQQYRQNLFSTWAHHLQQAGIQYRPDIARVEVLQIHCLN